MKLKDGKRLKKFAKKTAPKVKRAIIRGAKITRKYGPKVVKGMIGGAKAVGKGYQKAADHIDFEAITGIPDKPRKGRSSSGFTPLPSDWGSPSKRKRKRRY